MAIDIGAAGVVRRDREVCRSETPPRLSDAPPPTRVTTGVLDLSLDAEVAGESVRVTVTTERVDRAVGALSGPGQRGPAVSQQGAPAQRIGRGPTEPKGDRDILVTAGC